LVLFTGYWGAFHFGKSLVKVCFCFYFLSGATRNASKKTIGKQLTINKKRLTLGFLQNLDSPYFSCSGAKKNSTYPPIQWLELVA